jgi:omega-hydroxy-beta-dihydromenaquinone-9 sulfotransferase
MPKTKSGGRRWSPRFFQGTDTITWAKLLVGNRFAVHPKYWYIAGIISITSTINLVLRSIQNGMYGRELSQVRIDKEPIFVIGHWRTGTTLLHEMLIQDPQFNYPDFFACFNPNHRLLTERFFKTYATFLAPEQRPMDNMAAGWDRPQEDEFALCLLGLPSTYADIAFPNRPPMYPGSLDLSGLTSGGLKRWKQTFRHFLQTLMFRDSRRLVLKSPPHTARIPVLLEMFPDARFVHIVRDPYVVFPSTVNLWKSLARGHCLQTPNHNDVEEKVLREYRIIYDRLEEARPLFRQGRFHEVRYENLIADPVGELGKVYSALELEGFDTARSRLVQYLRQTTGYETNKYTITDEQRKKIEQRWGDVIERYGYS